MSDMIRGPIGPGERPEHLGFEALEGDKHREQNQDDEEQKRQRVGARLDSLGIDSQGYSEEQIREIVDELKEELALANTPNELLEALLRRYGFDMSKRNLPPGSITVVINGIIRTVLLVGRSGQRARDAVEAILQKHQVAAKNPFGL